MIPKTISRTAGKCNNAEGQLRGHNFIAVSLVVIGKFCPSAEARSKSRACRLSPSGPSTGRHLYIRHAGRAAQRRMKVPGPRANSSGKKVGAASRAALTREAGVIGASHRSPARLAGPTCVLREMEKYLRITITTVDSARSPAARVWRRTSVLPDPRLPAGFFPTLASRAASGHCAASTGNRK